MRIGKLFALLAAIAVLAACGGGGTFVPNLGPFSGVLTADSVAVGTISLTTSTRVIGGTGSILHSDAAVNVSIAGVVEGHVINGTISNSNLGSGYFIGEFTDKDSCYGTFEYTDTMGFATTAGTWVADIQ